MKDLKPERKRKNQPPKKRKRRYAKLLPTIAERRRSSCCGKAVEDKPRGERYPYNQMMQAHCARCGQACEPYHEKAA